METHEKQKQLPEDLSVSSQSWQEIRLNDREITRVQSVQQQ
jgi:hypothetical protein